jgi:hypothetical protein
MMLQPSMELDTEDEQTSLARVSRASPTALRDHVRRLVTSVISGVRSSEYSARRAPDGFWEKTFQDCLALNLERSLEGYSMTWSKSGTAWDGLATELPMLERCIDGTESSLLPIARRSEAMASPLANYPSGVKGRLEQAIAHEMLPTPRAGKMTNENEETWRKRQAEGKVSTPPLALAVQMLPTPTASDGTTGAIFGENDQYSVKASGNIRKTTPSGASGTIGLARTMMLATPAAADCQGSHGGGQGKSLRTDMHQYKAETGERGTLNPSFVCRMMGFPDEWLEID